MFKMKFAIMEKHSKIIVAQTPYSRKRRMTLKKSHGKTKFIKR